MISFPTKSFCFYTLHLTLPVKLEVCSPKTLPSTTIPNGNSWSSPHWAVCRIPCRLWFLLTTPTALLSQVSKTPPVPAVLPTFWLLLLGPFSGLTSLLSVLHFSTPGLLPVASTHSPRHSGSIYTQRASFGAF